jgi:hypothetical protein
MAKRGPKGPRMTELQKAFVREFLVDLNAAQALFRAGYNGKAAALWGHGLSNAQMSRLQSRLRWTCGRGEPRSHRTSCRGAGEDRAPGCSSILDEAGICATSTNCRANRCRLRGMDVVIESGASVCANPSGRQGQSAGAAWPAHGMFDDRLKVSMRRSGHTHVTHRGPSCKPRLNFTRSSMFASTIFGTLSVRPDCFTWGPDDGPDEWQTKVLSTIRVNTAWPRPCASRRLGHGIAKRRYRLIILGSSRPAENPKSSSPRTRRADLKKDLARAGEKAQAL